MYASGGLSLFSDFLLWCVVVILRRLHGLLQYDHITRINAQFRKTITLGVLNRSKIFFICFQCV